ncbi:meiotically up-regulated protein 80 protein-like [Teratosphaeria destructans]|uniref:Meiotically up-regulated protein 80 protein-like n=1 Tax=Teratosphaeria destructans TaxID=418781 RepID=A0A9W7W6E7_9PEZI|nr:meiotically up-regulated protein 80 protein-like [Teratosphaeria destructans]
MPSFYSSRPLSQLPLTPPDSTGYGYSNMHYAPDPYAQHQQNLTQGTRHNSAYDYQGYMQPPVAPAPPSYSFQQGAYPHPNTLPPMQSYYEPMGAPILPPLRINEHPPITDDYQRRLEQEQQAREQQQRQAAKEEKATGGVSAKLDYDMERMTDFVTGATERMYALHCNPHISVADVNVPRSFAHEMQSRPSFRKWVLQVLSATRLPSATILLSLHYLNDRVARHPETVSTSENQIYRLLAVSLILGSKFLDDNTFINRSWSDVTAIKVVELNQLERDWLRLISYNLHVDASDPNGLRAWLGGWEDYQQQIAQESARQEAQRLDALAKQEQQQRLRLSPINTNVSRHSSHRDRFSPYPTPYTASAARSTYEHTPARNSAYGNTYTVADPWSSSDRHAFDDFYKRQQRYPTLAEIDDVNRRASEERARQSAYAYSQSAQSGYYQQPTYSSAWEQPAWTASHRYDCACSGCMYQNHYRPYSMSSGYAAQTVMG